MTAFDTAWDLVKAPYIPGSMRPIEGQFKEGDDTHAPAQLYEGDFYDPVDEITRRIEIDPMREYTGSKEGFGWLRDLDNVEAAYIDMTGEEGREPEMAFGLKQNNPFIAMVDNKLDRIFVPSDLRRRGIASGLADALHEYRMAAYAGTSGEDSAKQGMNLSSENSEDMLNLLASRNIFPKELAKLPEHMKINNETYYHTNYGRQRWPGSKEDAPPPEERIERFRQAAEAFAERQRIEEELDRELYGDDY